MNINQVKTWNNDLDRVLDTFPEISRLAGKTVFITGASGLICSPIVDLFIRFNQKKKTYINIIVAGRNEERMRDRFRNAFDEDYFAFFDYDSTRDNIFDFECDYIIHGASNAFPKSISTEPVETMISNVIGLKQILDYSRDSQSGNRPISRVLYISSSEVYGNKGNNYPFVEDEYGIVDILNPRNSYSESKRASETLCIAYNKEYGVDTVTVRPGHIYGPTASEKDNRVSSMWAYDAASGRDIVMKSDGAQIRSYTYCLDCASAIVKVLLKGQSGDSYNISNPDSIITIKEMAEILAKSSDVKLIQEIPDIAESKTYNLMTNSSLNSDKLEGLGWKGLFDSYTGLSHTVDILKEMKCEV